MPKPYVYSEKGQNEETIVNVTGEILETLGYRVLKAKSGRETVDIYEGKKDEIFLVILDMIMPDNRSGAKTFDLLKKNQSPVGGHPFRRLLSESPGKRYYKTRLPELHVETFHYRRFIPYNQGNHGGKERINFGQVSGVLQDFCP